MCIYLQKFAFWQKNICSGKRPNSVYVPYKWACQTWTKELAQEMINESHEDSYLLLPYYCPQIESTSPNSTAIVECYKETIQFQYSFFCCLVFDFQPEIISTVANHFLCFLLTWNLLLHLTYRYQFVLIRQPLKSWNPGEKWLDLICYVEIIYGHLLKINLRLQL